MQIIKPENYNVPKPPPSNNNNNNNNGPAPAINNNVPNNPFKATNMFVCGAGKMGSSVAAELAVNGYHVAVHDGVHHKIETLMARIYDRLTYYVNRTKLLDTMADIDAILARIRVAASLEEARDADIVFECCVDDISAKKRVLGKLDDICPKTTVLATASLNIPLSEIVPHCKKFPGRVIGTRFLYPVLFIPRIELSFYMDPYCFGIKKMMSFLKSINKQPYFYAGKGEREILSHDAVVAIYEDQAMTFKKLGYPGKVTIPQVFNTNAPAPSPSLSPSPSPSPLAHTTTSSSVSSSNSNNNNNNNNEKPRITLAEFTSRFANLPVNTISSNPSPSTPPSNPPPSSNPNPLPSNPPPSNLPPSNPTNTPPNAAAVGDDSKKCVVCMEADRNSVMIPCGHICACFNCGDAITKSATPICPICRVDIKTLVMTFVA